MSNSKKSITVLSGDGIGPEVVREALKVLLRVGKKYNIEFDLDFQAIGACAIEETGQPLPESTIESCLQSDAVLLGAIGDPKYDNDPSATVRPEQGLLALRKQLELFANIRPVKVYKSLVHHSPIKQEVIKDTDLVIYRELTGGIYFGEKVSTPTSASDLCEYHDYEIERICRLACEAALRRRKKICLVDKANVLESSRLWRKVFTSVAEQYDALEVEMLFVDNAAMQLIINPSRFDVIVTSNMFGDILSDEASVLSGSIGLLASSSIGKNTSLYEPVHGSFPQAAGKDKANPIATILSVQMLLEDLGLSEAANDIHEAVNAVIEQGYLTADLSKSQPRSCSEVGEAIANEVLKLRTNNFGVII